MVDKTVPCFVCGKELENFQWDSAVEVHPSGGLAFRTYGHYGSVVFDPMDGTSLDIAICDLCVMKNLDRTRGTGKQDLEDNVDMLIDAAERHG